MERVAKFYKVSFERFAEDLRAAAPDMVWTDAGLREIYEGIRLPLRATEGSAGYDIYAIQDVKLNPDPQRRIRQY